jgi:hypothetical protein
MNIDIETSTLETRLFLESLSRQISKERLRALLRIARRTPQGEISLSGLAQVVGHPLTGRHPMMRIASRLDAVKGKAVCASTVHAVPSKNHDQ